MDDDRGVRIAMAESMDDVTEVAALLRRVWDTSEVLDPSALRAMAKAGNYVAGAWVDGRMVGASAAFFGPPRERSLHSHVTGVLDIGRGVGRALKLHQRQWALERGVVEVAWTFDPLVRRNAWFNIGRLGGLPTAYLPDFYGVMADAINAGDRSDRLLLSWPIGEDRVAAAIGGTPPPCPTPAVTALDEVDGRPVAGTITDDALLVCVPADIERLRRADPSRAADWRAATREVLGGLLDGGRAVVGFDRDRGYVVGSR